MNKTYEQKHGIPNDLANMMNNFMAGRDVDDNGDAEDDPADVFVWIRWFGTWMEVNISSGQYSDYFGEEKKSRKKEKKIKKEKGFDWRKFEIYNYNR